MLENILNLVKDQVLPAISGNADIPEDKKEAAVEATTSTILSGLKDSLIPGNLTEVMNMFGGGGSSGFGGNPMVQGIQSSVVSALTDKVGLNAGIASTIAATVVPAVIGMFTNKVNNDSDPGFSVKSLISAFAETKTDSGGGGILGMLGGLFGGK